MKIKKSRLKAIILEELERYKFEQEFLTLMSEALTPAQLAHIDDLEKEYTKKMREKGPRDEPFYYMAPTPKSAPDIENKFKWIAYYFIHGWDWPKDYIKHYAAIMHSITPQKFLENVKKYAGGMLYKHDWKKHPPHKDREPEVSKYLKDFTDLVIKEYEQMIRDRDLRTTQGIKPPVIDSGEDTKI